MRAGIYLRQSRDVEGTGAAVDRQREDCVALCQSRGWPIIETFIDNDVSATSVKRRPSYDRMLVAADAGRFDVIVAWHADRLARKLTDLEHLVVLAQRTGVKIATVTGDLDLTTDTGRLVARILASVAAGEVERKSARQRRANLQRAQAGDPLTGPRPFGYDADRMTIRPAEAAAVARLYESLLAGTAVRSLAADLNRRGFVTGRGNPWRHTSLRALLMNPRNAGLRAYHGEIIGPATWPAIVGEETWRAAVSLLGDGARRKTTSTATRWLLTGIAACGPCSDTGRPTLVVSGSRGRGVSVYRCRISAHMMRKADVIDELVAAVVVERLRRPDARELLVDQNRPDVDALRADALALRQRLHVLAVEFADGSLTAGQLRTATERVRARLSDVEQTMASGDRAAVLRELVGVADVDRVWQSLPLDRRRAVVRALMDVTILRGRSGRGFDPESVRIEWKGNT